MPIKEGGLGLRIPSENADISYQASKKITKPLKEKIVTQFNNIPAQKEVKKS